jgi:hypothetical protein
MKRFVWDSLHGKTLLSGKRRISVRNLFIFLCMDFPANMLLDKLLVIGKKEKFAAADTMRQSRNQSLATEAAENTEIGNIKKQFQRPQRQSQHSWICPTHPSLPNRGGGGVSGEKNLTKF